MPHPYSVGPRGWRDLNLLIALGISLALPNPGNATELVIPDNPPIASLIEVSDPDASGDVTVTGKPGAVPPNSFVMLVTLDTGHFEHSQAARDGSFSVSTFAPAGTSILIKADPSGAVLQRVLDEIFRSGGEGNMAPLAGTILRVEDPPATGPEVPFGGAGAVGEAATCSDPSLPSWIFQGTISSQELAPGETFRLRGLLSITSPALQEAGEMRVSVRLTLIRLSRADGVADLAHNTLASVLLTPTGFPIERRPQTEVFLEHPPEFPLTKVVSNRAEAVYDRSVTLLADLPPGYYRPVLGFFFEGVPEECPPTRPILLVDKLGNRADNTMYLPVVRVGNPAAPRVFSTLLTDTLSNGTRGVGAAEDRGRFGIAARILTQSETFIVPRLNSASGEPLTYRLEPFAPTLSRGDRGIPPDPPLIPFRFPSGRLTVQVRKPDGSVDVLGPASFVQARVKTLVDRNGETLDRGGGHLTDVYQLSTMDPSFEFQFTQDGRHLITLDGSIEDIWGNTWSVGGAYEVHAARPLSLDTAVLPMTSFEVGDVFAPGLLLTPPVAALVDVRFRLLPNSDPGRTIEWRVSGQANRFGYFNPDSAGMPLEFPGEYRVDVTASFRDKPENLWMGSRTWGGVVAPRNSGIIAHGRRGIDDLPDIGPQWFFRTQTSSIPRSSHVPFPFHSGDISWLEEEDAVRPILTFQDPGGQLISLLRPHNIDAGHDGSTRFEERAAAGETPLFSSGPVQSTVDPHLDPSNLDFWGYGYMSVQRPLVRVREEIAEDTIAGAYWRFDAQYACQIGMGPNGDLKNDIKFQYGGVVLRGAAIGEPQYAIYGSLFVLVPDDDPAGGTRTFPPFQGNGGGPSGGPIMTLKGREVDLFIHLTGVRPGTILEAGDTFALTGAVGPTLPAFVAYAITKPGGQKLIFSGRANKIGYYYHPEHNFVVEEPGIYTVDLRVTYDGLTSAGQVTEPFPSGDVLGTADGRFFFYVVPRGSAPLAVDLPEYEFLPPPADLTITTSAPDGLNLNSAHVTTMMPGFLLESGEIDVSSKSFTYRYDPSTLARDFPNLDVESDEEPEAADVITISLFGSGTGADGKPAYMARVVVLHGKELLNPEQAVVAPNPTAAVNAASFAAGAAVAPGSIASVFGTNLASVLASSNSLPLPTLLGGTVLRFNGIAAPLFFTSPSQVNLQVPWELAGQEEASVTGVVGGLSGEAQTVRLAPFAPGIFTTTQTGTGQGAILIAGTAAIAAPSGTFPGARPLKKGEFISMFCTGLGEVTNRPASGAPAQADALSLTTAAASVTIGGAPAPVTFSGLAPGFVGLYQVNAQVPENAATGDALPLILTIGGATSNTVTVAVR